MTETVNSQHRHLKDFKRIQESALSQDGFDGIEHFPECGGIGIFVGTVRDHHEGKAVKALKYTAYAPVAEKMIRQIEQEIQIKHGISYVRVIHRVGALDIGEKAIIAMAYAPHRREAFAACEEAVERVKHEVPVWKEEFYMDGSSQYVEGCCIRKDHEDELSHTAPHQHSKQCDHIHHRLRAHSSTATYQDDHLPHEQPTQELASLTEKQHESSVDPAVYQWHL